MVLHLTQKLTDRLELSALPTMAEDNLFSWRAHYIQENGFQFFVFMNEASRFTVVIDDTKAVKLKNLPEIFITKLRAALLAHCINPEVVDRYIAELGEISYARNADRKKTLQLNQNVEEMWMALQRWDSDADVSFCVNKMLFRFPTIAKLTTPELKIRELLAKYDLPVVKFKAFDLTVRLLLDDVDAVRNVRVSANISFRQLHKILQRAFCWQDYHLCSFGLVKEWSENYYRDSDVRLVFDEEDLEYYPDAKLMGEVKLSDFIPEYKKIQYIYDFGDGWIHLIELTDTIDGCEEIVPLLLSGEGDAPPEDSGGIGGFADFLDIISDPKHEEYHSMTEWAKDQCWERFDYEKATKRVKYALGYL